MDSVSAGAKLERASALFDFDEEPDVRGRSPAADRRLQEASALSEAVDGLWRLDPSASAKIGVTAAQRAGGYSVLGAALVFLTVAPDATAFLAVVAGAAVFAALILLRLFAIFARLARRAPAPPRPKTLVSLTPTYTLLVPLLHEANIVADLVSALNQLDYPADQLDILLLIESDDAETLAAAEATISRAPLRILPVPCAGPRTKPKALNYGLAFARGDFVAVYDAEDRPDPAQLKAALQAFQQHDAKLAVVQAPLFTHNGHQSWIARQFELEYTVHFGVWLPAFAQLGWPLPLGGTSNHFRLEALRDVGGWDPYNVTEDADLGMRLAASGYTASMISPPTYEEAPISIKQWLFQRTRWIKGHLQTWLVLMRAPITMARRIGPLRFLGAQLAFSGGLLSAFLHAPLVLFTLVGVLTPLAVFDVWHGALLSAGYLCAAMCAVIAGPIRGRGLALMTMPLYWPLQTVAAIMALVEMKSRPHLWRKTPHGLTPHGGDAKSA